MTETALTLSTAPPVSVASSLGSSLLEEESQSSAQARAGSWFFAASDERQSLSCFYQIAGAFASAITAPIEETLNWLTSKGVKIELTADVRSYLLQFPDLLLVIPSIWKKASDTLLPATQFTLTVYRDPEIEDEYLTLYARQHQYENGILSKLRVINVECEELLSSRSGWLIASTDFRQPK